MNTPQQTVKASMFFELDKIYAQCCSYAILNSCSLDEAQLDVLGEIVFAENGNVCKLKAENELNITIVSDEKTAASRDVEKNITKRKNENVNI